MSGPRTTREALVAEVLGEMDTLLARVEALPAAVAGAEERLSATVAALDAAGDRYRLAVTAFTDQAKLELVQRLEAHRATAIDEQRAALHEAARAAFHTHASDNAARLATTFSEAAKNFRVSIWSRLIEHAITALIASSFTAGLVYAISG